MQLISGCKDASLLTMAQLYVDALKDAWWTHGCTVCITMPCSCWWHKDHIWAQPPVVLRSPARSSRSDNHHSRASQLL